MILKRILLSLTTALALSATLSAYDDCNLCFEPCETNLCCDPCDGWSLSADWIFWKTRECNLQYGIPFSDESSASNSTINGHGFAPSTEYASGFRVGIRKSCGEMGLGVRYTRYCISESDRRENSSGDFFANTRLGYAFKQFTDRAILLASARYKLDLDIVDAEADYRFDLSSCIDSRAFAGFRYASIDRKLAASYSNELAFNTNTVTQDNISLTNNMDAYGVYFGNEARFKLIDCLHFVGSFDLGLLAADIERTAKYSGIAAGTAVTTPAMNLKDDCWKIICNLNLALGVEYELPNCFCGDWSLGMGYEFHQWQCLPEFINLIITQGATANTHDQFLDYSNNCLSFDGLYVRLNATF